MCQDGHAHHYQSGQVIFREGEAALGLYFLVSGKVKIVKEGIFGREQIVRMAHNGDLLTYRAVSGIPQYVVSAAAMEDSFVFYLHLENVLDVLKKNGAFAYKVIQKLTQELDNAEKVICNLAQKTVKQRVAELLLSLRDKYAASLEDNVLHLQLSREELANIVGTATETVVRCLSDFRKKNMIQIEGHDILILDSERLEKIACVNS